MVVQENKQQDSITRNSFRDSPHDNKPALITIVKHNIYWKVLLPIVIFFHVLFGINLFFEVMYERSEALHKAHQGTKAIDEYINEILKYLRIYAVKATISKETHKSIMASEECVFISKYFYSIYLINADGDFVSLIYPPDVRQYHGTPPLVTSSPLYNEYPYEILSPYYSTTAREMVWGIKYFNMPEYILVGEINLKKFWQRSKHITAGGFTTFYVDNHGKYIIHSDFEKVRRQEHLPSIWFKKIKEKHFTIGNYEGSWFLISAEYSDLTSTWCIVLTPIHNIIDPMLRLYLIMTIIFLTFLIISNFLSSRWINTTIIAPLEKFSNFVSRDFPERKDIINHPNGFFPFKEGVLLEESFRDAANKLNHREKALKESESKYKTLFETANDAILILQDNIFIDVNKKTLEMFNCRQEEIIGRTPYDLSPEKQPDGSESKTSANEKIRDALRGIPQKFEWVSRKCDGTDFYVEVSLTLLTPGEKPLLQAIVRDITDRKDMETALRESEYNFRNLVETAPIGIMVFQDNRFVFVNTEVERTTKYTKDELLSMIPFWRIVDEKYHKIVEDIVHKCLSEPVTTPIISELVVITKSKRKRLVRCATSSIWRGNRLAGLVTAMDITVLRETEKKKRELEQMLYRSQRLESIGTLVAGVAHEFNNLLQAIMLNIERLKSSCERVQHVLSEDTIDLSDCEKHFKNIQSLYHRAKSIIKELLVFSRDGMSDQKRKVTLSLHEEINRVVSICKSTFPPSINISTSLNATNDIIRGEPGLVEQVLLNILNNARDAIQERGSSGYISIETKNVKVVKGDFRDYPLPEGEYIMLSIKDNGIGIDEVNLARIFDPFFTTKPPGKGTGLGLSVVYGIMKELGGMVTCKSEKGKGSEFSLFFPLTRLYITKAGKSIMDSPTVSDILGDTHQQRKDPDSVRFRQKGKVLVVEDEAIAGNLIAQFLESQGFQVSNFTTPEEGLESLEESNYSYDLIITDLGLPGIGGEGFLKELKKRDIKLPVIVITGYLTSPEKIQYFKKDLNVKDFLLKPFTTEELIEAVKKVLR